MAKAQRRCAVKSRDKKTLRHISNPTKLCGSHVFFLTQISQMRQLIYTDFYGIASVDPFSTNPCLSV